MYCSQKTSVVLLLTAGVPSIDRTVKKRKACSQDHTWQRRVGVEVEGREGSEKLQ